MQSVGNMPPPPLGIYSHTFSRWCQKNPKYDQFQSKGHHNEENPQSMTQMARNPKFDPFHWVEIAQKLRNRQTATII